MATGRILIVDDDGDWREFLRICVEDLGYEAVEAHDGQQALSLMEDERFSIILLDLNMPGLDGREVLRRLPSPPPRVVLLTSAGLEDLGGALSSEAYYLPKDATSDSLPLILESLHA